MAKIDVNKVGDRARAQDAAVVEDTKKRVHLHTHSAFEQARPTFAGIGKQDLSAIGKGSDDPKERVADQAQEADEAGQKIRLPNGTEVELPRLSRADRERVDAVRAAMRPADRERLIDASNAYGQSLWRELKQNPETLALGQYSSGLQSASNKTFEASVMTDLQKQEEDHYSDAILQNMSGAEQRLQDFFGKVRYGQAVASELRTDVADIRAALADWPDDGSTEVFDYRQVVYHEDGSIGIVEHTDVTLTKAEAQALLLELEGQVTGLGEFDTRSMMELQFMVQQFQQAMNVTSNILKQNHETQKSILQNVRA